jgi:glutaryl-CoA dehydrogenase (non-decarboxylating)
MMKSDAPGLESLMQPNAEQVEFRTFVDREIVPEADRFDREECVPRKLVEKLVRHGYLGAALHQEYGGRAMNMITYGLLHQEVGRGCSSVRSLLTAHDMVAHTLSRWGSKKQKGRWLPQLATGKALAAFGLTEPDVGSDAQRVQTTATRVGSSYILNGHKAWMTFGQIADVFLIIGQCDGNPAAFLVERETHGLSLKPISGMLGNRASMLAEVHLERCTIPAENLIGNDGFGFSQVVSTALDHGRYSVAWGCVGVAQACLDASLTYAHERKQFGTQLENHQLIRRMITDMIIGTKAARLLCFQAGYLKCAGDPRSMIETSIAKYFASTSLVRIANDAVQIHGANGCSSAYPVQRYLRDSKIMEIIEGSTQIHQITIAQYGFQDRAESMAHAVGAA